MAATAIYSVTMVLWKETAFPLWRATERRWKRNVVSWVSSATVVICLSISSHAMYQLSLWEMGRRCVCWPIWAFVYLGLCCLLGCCTWFSPCSPRASTALPHTQVCGSQASEPNMWATSTLMALSDSHSPTAVIVGACSQSPECGDAAARSLALSTSDGALERIRFFWFAATGPSEAFWMCCVSWEGFAELARSIHNVSSRRNRLIALHPNAVGEYGLLEQECGCSWSQIGRRCQHLSTPYSQTTISDG